MKPENSKKRLSKGNVENLLKRLKTVGVYNKAILEKITVKDFMCHANLAFDIKPQCNFVIGENGSGKSAIFHALVLALDGKAKDTSKNTTLGEFIMRGKRSCSIQVQIQNKLPNAYKPELYGESIIVERKIILTGPIVLSKDESKKPKTASTSTFTLKSKKGVPISHSHNELKLMLRHLNIHVANPINFLNQDTSKEFLSQKSPESMYLFFHKATHLEEIFNTVKAVHINISKCKLILKNNNKMKRQTLDVIKELEKDLKGFELINRQEEQVKELKENLCWANLYLINKTIQSFKSYLVNNTTSFQKNLFEREKLQDEFTLYKSSHDGKVKRHEELKNISTTLREEEEILKGQRHEIREKLNGEKLLETSAKKEKDKVEKLIGYLNSEIDKEQQKDKNILEAAKERRQREILGLESLLSIEEQKKEMLENDYTDKQKSIGTITSELSTLRYDQKTMKRDLKINEEQIDALTNTNKPALELLGKSMPNFVSEIKNIYNSGPGGGFTLTSLPRGPIGSQIKLKTGEMDWSDAIETSLRGCLNNFCVDNFTDFDNLTNAFKKVRNKDKDASPMPTIIVSKFSIRPHDVSRFKPQNSKYPTILDKLEIKDVVIRNLLIDQAHVESILLIDSDEKTRKELMKDTPATRGCRFCMTKEGDKLHPGRNFRYYSNRYNPKHVLKASEERIEIFEKSRAKLIKEISESEIKKKHLDAKVIELKERSEIIKSQLDVIQEKIQDYTGRIRTLKNKDTEEKPKCVDALQRNLETNLKDFQNKESLWKSKEQDVKKLEQEIVEIEESLTEKTTQRVKMTRELDVLKKDLFNHDSHTKNKDEKIKMKERLMKDCLANIGAFTAILTTTREEYDKKINEASLKFEVRKEISRKPEDISKQIQGLMIQINEDKRIRTPKAKLVESLKNEKLKLAKLEESIGPLEIILDELSTTMDKRSREYIKIREQVCMSLNVEYAERLGSLGFRGSLDIDHKIQSIQFKFDGGKRYINSDLKALSGGERSTIGAVFLISLWEMVESPFRVLDEFDVFMDDIYRKKIYDMLLKLALGKPNDQYLCITPQSMDIIDPKFNVNIYKLSDPRQENKLIDESD